MSRRQRSALGADALRGLLGAEELGSAEATAAKEPAAPAAARPAKPRERQPRRRRRTTPKPASAVPPAPEAAAAVRPEPSGGGPSQPPPRPRRTNVQGYIDAQVLDRARDAAFWTPGVSLSALIEHGLRKEIARLEAERGEPFPRRRGPLTPGPSVR